MTIVAALAALLLGVSNLALAHPGGEDDGTRHDSRHALHDFGHDSDAEGHIDPDVNYGLRLVGQDTLAGVDDGRYTDVWADGRGYAYVGTFEEPTCDRSGVYISDISDPENPTTVSMVKSPPNTRVNDVKTVEVDGMTVLIHTLEPCGTTVPSGTQGQGGIALWDVTDPTQPRSLKRNFLDFGVHNTYPWHDGDNTYLIGVNDDELQDVFIVDITKPQSPKLLSEVGLPDWPDAQDEQSDGTGAFSASFNHDVWVTDLGDGDFQAVVSYWDAGFVTLDVNDPANPMFVDDSTYPDPDPVNGFSPPEGNAHAAVYNADSSQILAGDEDFDPYRVVAEITSGTFAGTLFNGTQGDNVPQISDETGLVGQVRYVGTACGGDIPDPDGATIALIERGGCTFTLKAQTAEAEGYEGAIVFNSEGGDPPCEASVSPIAEAGIPFLFVARSVGYELLGIEGYDPDNCPGGENPALPAVGALGESVSVTAEWDGWGYFHLLDRETLDELGYYAPAQVNDPAFAEGFGDLTMHNVEGDPDDPNVAYIAWYSLGMRVVELNTGADIEPPEDETGAADWEAATPAVDDYYGNNVTEVGRWISPDGSNFWGVTVTEIGGQEYILASDRNSGLHIFQMDESYCEIFVEDGVCP
ncbi:MAG TPA: PA domain-containing protein [Euzebyales bacterium]